MDKKVTTKGVNDRAINIKETQDLRNEKYYSWLKNIITVSIALFTLIISLKKGNSKSNIESLFFIISITSLGLGILSALITLYGEVRVLDFVRSKYYDILLQYLDEGQKIEPSLEDVEVPLLYKVSSYLYVIFYLISLFCLIFYSIIEELKNVSQQCI